MLDPLDRVWQKWQGVGGLNSGRVIVNKHRLFSPLLQYCRKIEILLEQRQYKNDSIQSKITPILKLARFFPHCIGGEKERQFQSWNYFRLNGVLLTLS